MKKHIEIKIVISIIMALTLVLTGCSDGVKKIEKKIANIVNLRESLRNKMNGMLNFKNSHEHEIRSLKNNVVKLKNVNNIKNYKEAIKNREMTYNLLLISKAKTYIQKIDMIVPKIRDAINELDYLEKDSRIDLGAVKVFGDSNSTEITRKIDKIIKKYSSTSEWVIEIDKEQLESMEKIWKEMFGKGG